MQEGYRIEFSVEVIRREGDSLFIGGRCYDSPIRLGDRFSEAFRYRPVESIDDYGQPAQRVAHSEHVIDLEVKSIKIYGINVNQIDSGLTAELQMIGSADKQLEEGEVMGGLSRLPRFE